MPIQAIFVYIILIPYCRICPIARRASLKKISKSWVALTDEQRKDWDRLAEHASGVSVFGQKAEISGMNLFVRLNANRVMAGESMIQDAPASQVTVPNVSYTEVVMTPQLIVFTGIKHEPAPYKLVVKMSSSQSPGISSGWSKTVIISSDTEDDWGEADLTKLYLKTIGVEPVPGQKVFIESYWMDTSNGFTGQIYTDSVIVTGESSYQPRKRVTMDNLDPDTEQHVSALDIEYSTGAPIIYFDAVCPHDRDRQAGSESLKMGIDSHRDNHELCGITPQSNETFSQDPPDGRRSGRDAPGI